MGVERWLKELCPEISEWQIEIIAEHIEGITREAFNQGFLEGHKTAEKLQYQLKIEGEL